MKKAIYLSSIYLLFSLLSCTTQPKLNSSTPLFEAEFVDAIKLSNYFTQMDYVFLEESTDGLFMNADVIEFFEDHWYILDEDLKTILCFCSDGKFKFRIHAVGQGPGEYRLPSSMFIHKSKREIWVQDQMGLRIMRYDLNGRFISHLPLGRAGVDMVQFNESEIICFDEDYHFFSKDDSTFPGLFLLDEKFKTKEQIFRIEYDILLNQLLNQRCLTMLNDTCFFTYASDSLLSFSQDKKMEVKGVFDFGKHHLPERIRTLPNRFSNYEQIIESGKVIWKNNFIPHPNFFFLTLGFENSYWYGIINRQNNSFKVSQGFVNDISKNPFAFPIAQKSSTELVGFISADYIIAMQESLENLSEDQQNDNTLAMKKFAEKALSNSGNTLVVLTTK